MEDVMIVQLAGARGAGLEVPMAVAQWQVLRLRMGMPVGLGIGGKVKELRSAVPIGDVDSIGVKPVALGHTITLTLLGTEIELAATAGSRAAHPPIRLSA
jgi:hypothetical protein